MDACLGYVHRVLNDESFLSQTKNPTQQVSNVPKNSTAHRKSRVITGYPTTFPYDSGWFTRNNPGPKSAPKELCQGTVSGASFKSRD